MKTISHLLKLVIPLVPGLLSCTKKPERPNIILFLADDMG